MAETLPEFGNLEAFVDDINGELSRRHISPDELSVMDHVCYRVETDARYNELRRKFGETAALLIDESEVGGRFIATFEFVKPLKVGGWEIPYLELPQPKDGSPYSEGLEHAEFVVVGGLPRFIENHPDLSAEFGYKGMEKIINPELRLKNTPIRFHDLQLGAVVRIEQQLARDAADKARANESV